MDPIDRVNHFLDALPRIRFGSLAREAPAFRSCGIAGFYVAVVVTLSTGAARGRSLAVLAALASVCGASFFAYALARKRVTGGESLVLLEHVWVALGCSTGVLVAFGEPPLGYLDAVVSGLAFFLAAGRVGCFLAGCCHGHPASVGVRYGPDHARDGFPAHWLGVRLFPVQLVEAAALAAIGLGAVLFALLGRDGAALSFFLVAYAVTRFGLEALRGDERPHLLGISQSRWMAIAELGAAIALAERARAHPRALAVLGLLAAVWVVRTALASRLALGARATATAHLAALREAAGSVTTAPLVAVRSPLGFGVAASPSKGGRLVSLSLPDARLDLPLLCRVAAGAFPDLEPGTALLGDTGVLLFEVAGSISAEAPDLAARLHAQVARARQAAQVAAVAPDPVPAAQVPKAVTSGPRFTASAGAAARTRYFAQDTSRARGRPTRPDENQ